MPTRSISLAKKVPVFIGTLLLVVLGVAFTIEYVQLRRLLTDVNQERLGSATVLVAGRLTQQLQQGLSDVEETMSRLVAELLVDGRLPETAPDSSLLRRLPTSGSTRAVAVWDRAGACVGAVRPSEHSLDGPRDPCVGRAATIGPEQIEVGPILDAGGSPRYSVVIPVTVRGWSGWVDVVSSTGDTTDGELVSGLIDVDAELILGNVAGGAWTNLSTIVDGPPGPVPADGPMRFELDGEQRMGAAARVEGTPWVTVAHRSVDVALAPSDTFLASIIGSGFLVLIVSSVVGGLASMRVTRPLAVVTRGAEAVAAGEYSRRVPVEREDEVGRLARAFNTMADHVDDRRQTLEARVEQRTRSLQDALDQLAAAQDQVVRTERLATLGQLAGGVGHELRNPLGVMTNALYYLEAVNPDAPPKVREYIGILKAQVGISEKIVSDLLDFARLNTPDRTEVDLEALVRESLARQPVRDGITVRIDMPDKLPTTFVDQRQMEQVMVNLISNAVHAMQDEEGTLSFTATPEDDRVILRVTDTGSGMSEEQLERIFEPLVTTKAKGIGLGLAVSRLLASTNGVELTVESEPGVGSTFQLGFPVHAGVPAS